MPGRPATTLIQHDAPESKLLALLSPQFPGEDVSLRSSTTHASKVVFLVTGDRDPGEFFLYEAKARRASFLFARMPWIEPESMAAMEPISLKARDGLVLHGYLTRPPGKAEAKDLPLVVFVHGGPHGPRDEWGFDPYVQVLASRGYAVLQVNYRGSGGYGRAFEQAGYREWGGKMQDDVTDATHWAFAQGIADPKRTCIFGGSYGGYAALEGAVKEPALYRCAIGYVGVYDLRMMYSRGDIQQSLYGENYLKRVLGEDDAELTARSPLAHIDRLKAKVMLIVGGQDKRVPPAHGLALHSALSKAHVEHEWLYQRTEGHGFYDEKHVEDLYSKVLAFLDRNIGAARTDVPVAAHD
jgi:dipeptidyl aminopeptidase/acylaminoacyl peptidase